MKTLRRQMDLAKLPKRPAKDSPVRQMGERVLTPIQRSESRLSPGRLVEKSERSLRKSD